MIGALRPTHKFSVIVFFVLFGVQFFGDMCRFVACLSPFISIFIFICSLFPLYLCVYLLHRLRYMLKKEREKKRIGIEWFFLRLFTRFTQTDSSPLPSDSNVDSTSRCLNANANKTMIAWAACLMPFLVFWFRFVQIFKYHFIPCHNVYVD